LVRADQQRIGRFDEVEEVVGMAATRFGSFAGRFELVDRERPNSL